MIDSQSSFHVERWDAILSSSDEEGPDDELLDRSKIDFPSRKDSSNAFGEILPISVLMSFTASLRSFLVSFTIVIDGRLSTFL